MIGTILFKRTNVALIIGLIIKNTLYRLVFKILDIGLVLIGASLSKPHTGRYVIAGTSHIWMVDDKI